MIGLCWALLVSGCGIWELWKSNEPVDTGLAAMERRCDAGIDAYCTCREAASLSPCTDPRVRELQERCLADEAELVGFLECHRALVDGGGGIDCLRASVCGNDPETKP